MKKLILIAAMFIGVYANASMNIKAVFDGPLCHGDATGTISIVMDGGITPYSFAWSTGATSRTISNLVAGSYTVTVTDNLGSSAVSTISIAEPFALTLSDMVINVNPNGASNGIVNLTVRGGTPDYSYAWSNGATTKDIGGLAAGDYTVVVTDGVGCQASLTSTVAEPLPQMVIGNSHPESRSMATGVDPISNVSLSVYPNPASSVLNLRLQAAEEAEYSLVNANGEVVMKEKISGTEAQADISNLPAGNYMVQVKTAKGTSNKNIVIAK